jgi:hypothetical protein
MRIEILDSAVLADQTLLPVPSTPPEPPVLVALVASLLVVQLPHLALGLRLVFREVNLSYQTIKILNSNFALWIKCFAIADLFESAKISWSLRREACRAQHAQEFPRDAFERVAQADLFAGTPQRRLEAVGHVLPGCIAPFARPFEGHFGPGAEGDAFLPVAGGPGREAVQRPPSISSKGCVKRRPMREKPYVLVSVTSSTCRSIHPPVSGRKK